MQIIADLQLHSKYSRAVSPRMDLIEISRWSSKKGIGLVATGDWQHPLWFKEITANLKETEPGIYTLRSKPADQKHDVKFLLSSEISSIYSQGGKVRRVHNLIFSPSIATCEKIIAELKRRGANLHSDGRPIVGISSKDLLEMVLNIDKDVLFIPAHCLPPYELIETKFGLKKVEKINIGDHVLSHTGNFRKVTEVFKRKINKNLHKIVPWYYSQGIETTEEHPFLAIKTIKKCPSTGDTCIPFGEHKKRCSNKGYKTYKKDWIPVKNLEIGDFICFPITKKNTDENNIKIDNKPIRIDEKFCLLIGYYLSEGCIDNKGGITFTFSSQEQDYCNEVMSLMKDVFGITHSRIYQRKNVKSLEIIFYSKKLAEFLGKNFYVSTIKRAPHKTIPHWMLYLPIKKQKQIIIGWFRGDGGYTSSIHLVSSINKIALRMGIISSISTNRKTSFNQNNSHKYKSRTIRANYDNYQIRFSFINDVLNLNHEKEFKRFNTKLTRRHGYIDDNFVYLPIRRIQKKSYSGTVYNFEVEKDHSYSTWVATVHNCWTPWFSIFGSKSGFDSIDECFGDLSRYVYAIETGLSSDPIMNWQIKELDNRSILSFSDAHSGPKLGREATVFISNVQHSTSNLNYSYADIANAIKQDPRGKLKIGYTIEFFPEEGKYHWSGHRVCGIKYNPQEIKEKGIICPKCSKPLTVGVENRVMDLSYTTISSDQLVMLQNNNGLTFVYDQEKKRKPFVSLIPLLEVLLELNNHSQVKAQLTYEQLISNFGTEFDILMKKSYEEIEKSGGIKLREAIQIIRKRRVFVDPGYDGVFGVVKIFNENDKTPKQEDTQPKLF